MIPHVTRGGRSFRGAFQYYLHDPGQDTRERIAWTQTRNMLTEDPDLAWKVMAYTAKSQDRLKQASGVKASGRKAEKPVLAYSLSWHPELDPSKDEILDAALKSLKDLGLNEHETMIVAHRDTPHRHVHVIVNRIHPITGKVASDSHTYRKLSEFARTYQLEHGLEYCPQREQNRNKREQGENAKYGHAIIRDAWASSDCGKSFRAALEVHGYQLAQGRKRIVVIDPYGKTLNPVRHLDGVKARVFKERLKDLDLGCLPLADQVAKQAEQRHQERKRPRHSDLAPAFNERSGQSIEPAAKPDPDIGEEASAESTAQGEWIAKQLNRLQDRHLFERSELSTHFQRKKTHAERSLGAFYRLEEQRMKIDELERKCAKAGFWRRLLGLAQRDRKSIEEHRLSLQSAEMRYAEKIDAIDREREHQLETLKQKQTLEWELEYKRILEASPSHALHRDYKTWRQKNSRQGPSREIGG